MSTPPSALHSVPEDLEQNQAASIASEKVSLVFFFFIAIVLPTLTFLSALSFQDILGKSYFSKDLEDFRLHALHKKAVIS